MKKLLLILLTMFSSSAAFAAVPCTANTPGTCAILQSITSDTTSIAVGVSGFQWIGVQVWSSAGATADVYIECNSDPNGTINDVAAPWFPCTQLANPVSATGEYWFEPRAEFVRVRVANQGNGTIYANMMKYK